MVDVLEISRSEPLSLLSLFIRFSSVFIRVQRFNPRR
jgi:hypothetical protein